MQCRSCSSWWYVKASPQDRSRRRCHGCLQKYRGKLASVILSYTKDMEEALKNAVPDRVFITHSGCDREIVESVRSYLESLGIFNEILETRAGGVISSHCGPGTLGVLFIEK